MANRKRNIQMKFYVTEEEKQLIDEKMKLLPTKRYGAYLRKMALDGYIIYTDTADIKAFTAELSAGVDYTEESITARIAGAVRPSRQPKEHSGKISLLIDIQNNIKAQQSAGYKRWATIENLKRFAETSNFLTEHGIASYGELAEKCEAAATAFSQVKTDLQEVNTQINALAVKMKHVATYRQLKPIYDRYKTSRDKEKFLRGNESNIILFEAAARELKSLGTVPLPTTERMKAEMDALTAWKTTLKTEQQQAQQEERRYTTMRRNVEEFLSAPAPEQQHQRKQELEQVRPVRRMFAAGNPFYPELYSGRDHRRFCIGLAAARGRVVCAADGVSADCGVK